MSGCGRGCHCRPGAAGFGGRLGHCVLHGADVLLGRHVKQGFIERRCRPGAPVAGVGGGSTDRTEAEPFTAKRSGTG